MKRRTEGCSEEALLLYYYGELDDGQRSRLEAHLKGCPACRESLRELQGVLGAVPRTETPLSDPEIRRFTGRVIERTRKGKGRRALPLWGGSLAAVAVAVIVLLSTRAPGPGPLPTAGNGTKLTAEVEVLQNYDMLQNLDLLENMDMLQQLETSG